MYEEKPRKKLSINWKSFIIKMLILLVAIFIIIWLISLVNKNNKNKEVVKPSNISSNLQTMKSAAFKYFDEENLPININGKKKITLNEMIEKDLLNEIKDQNNKVCDTKASYAEATKITSEDYTIKVKLVCNNESDYVINTITLEDSSADNIESDTSLNDEVETKEEVTTNTDKNTSSNKNNTSSNKNNSTNKNTSSNKNNSTSTNNSSNKNNTSNKNNSTTNNNVVSVTTCKYGKNEYATTYPLAYVISGNCAVSKNELYYAKHANAASEKGAVEYKKLVNEVSTLKTKTGADIYAEAPVYTHVLNKNGTGYVGYQIMFVVKQKYGYTTKTIYQYYIDQNGNRKVVIDNRSSLNSNTTNNSNNNNTNNEVNNESNTKVKSLVIRETALTMDVGDTHTFEVFINPSNISRDEIAWSSSNSSVVRVNSNGKITGRKAGTAVITAKIDNISDTVKVTIREEEDTYTYCKKETKRVYTTSYVDRTVVMNSTYHESNYNVVLEDEDIKEVNKVTYGNVSSDSEYRAAYNYLTNKDKELSLDKPSSGGINPGSYSNLKKHSLTSYNFQPKVTYTKNSGDKFYFNVVVNLKNLTIVYEEPYMLNTNYGVYFLPMYFDVEYASNNCVTVKKSEISKYKNDYIKVD